MKTNLIDLRSSKLKKTEIIELMRSNTSEAVILLGHGLRDSVSGMNATVLSEIPNVKIIWIYACECGLLLIHQLASIYKAVFGYATEVLAPISANSTVAHRIQKIMEEYDGDIHPRKISAHVQDSLLKDAVLMLRQARSAGVESALYIFQASIYNHTRLSLRIGLPIGS